MPGATVGAAHPRAKMRLGDPSLNAAGGPGRLLPEAAMSEFYLLSILPMGGLRNRQKGE